MGLFTDWITAPVAAPLRGVWRLARHAERAFYDDECIQRKLLELELRRTTGALDESTYRRLEAELLSLRQGVSEGHAAPEPSVASA